MRYKEGNWVMIIAAPNSAWYAGSIGKIYKISSVEIGVVRFEGENGKGAYFDDVITINKIELDMLDEIK